MTTINTMKIRRRRFCPPPTIGKTGSEFMNKELIENSIKSIAPFMTNASELSFPGWPFLTPKASSVKITKNIAIKKMDMLPNWDHKNWIKTSFEAAKKAKAKDTRKLTPLFLKTLVTLIDPNTTAKINRKGIKNCSD